MEDPATQETLAEVADADPADAVAAVDAAVDAQDPWRAQPSRERAEILRRTFEALRAERDELALLITLEMGKPLHEARAEVDYAAEFLRWFSEEAVRVDGRYAPAPEGGSRILVLRQPVGPCVLITPWNFPLAMGTRKIAPALAAGCTAVCKPAPQTPLSLLRLAALLDECGLPPGVVNVVTTSRAGEVMAPVLRDPRIRKLSFTGSTEVGRRLMAAVADQVLRVSMELGGNAPLLVFDDADLDRAVDGALVAKMRNIGESCIAANRIYVHRSLVGDFADRLATRMGDMSVGRGTVDGVEVGPLIDAAARDKVGDLVADAAGRGAAVLSGGRQIGDRGYFYAPTVLADVPRGTRLLHEEIFGPVAPIVAFDDEDEAVSAANDTPYGLVAYVFTERLDRALRVSEQLEVGMVGLNRGVVSNAAAPFGGTKHSGVGREGGAEGIEEYLETRYVAVDMGG